MRLGAPIFVDSDDPDELAREHRRLGYGAAFCPRLSLEDRERVRAVRDAFCREGVTIAEVGGWCNMMDPDLSKRAASLTYVTERLALADEVGARCCVNVAGSFSPTSRHGPHSDDLSPLGFDLTVENARKVIDAVKPRQARFVIEMEPYALPNSPEIYLRLFEAIDRPSFGIHLDPVNLINCPERYFNTGDLLKRCFSVLGPGIISCHAKDTLLHDTLTMHIDEVRPGLGVLDYAVYLRELARLPLGTTLMVEHLKSEEEYSTAVNHIRSVAAEVDVAFV